MYLTIGLCEKYINTQWWSCHFSPFLRLLLLSYLKLFSPFCHMTTSFIVLIQWPADNTNSSRITITLSHLRRFPDTAMDPTFTPAQHFVLGPCIHPRLCLQHPGSPEAPETKNIDLVLLSNCIRWTCCGCSHTMNLNNCSRDEDCENHKTERKEIKQGPR